MHATAKFFILVGAATLTLATAATVFAASNPLPQSKRDMQPKLSMKAARAIAEKTFPGRIMQAELEREHGGSGLRYSFDMRQGKQWREVGVDALTGKVLENSKESPNPKD
ncbi:MAG TPA: peptidase M4 [Betaproteobacteria bacterium]|nr:peptidase M4 [Betaproteobacteria bacterium]